MRHHTERLDHLGIMAGICDDIDPVEQIDRLVPAPTTASQYWASGESCGHQRLGFVNRPLYLPPEFFTDKAVDLDLPIGPGITAEVLNEDSLRRALGALYEAGLRRYSPRWPPRPCSSTALGIASSAFLIEHTGGIPRYQNLHARLARTHNATPSPGWITWCCGLRWLKSHQGMQLHQLVSGA